MTSTPTTVPSRLTDRPSYRAARFGRIQAQDHGRPQRKSPLMRRYEAAYLQANGDIGEMSGLAPAHPVFEDSFAAIARGTLVPTARGPVAVEDLLPGDEVKTIDNGVQTLLWRGGTTIIPGAAGQCDDMRRLIRIAADSLGIARPMPDLVLGPRARLYHRSAAIQRFTGRDGAFVPVQDFIDQINVIELTPPSPVPVFHLGFHRQERILANGVEIESQHPGNILAQRIGGDVLALYLSFFPHRASLSDFGVPAHVRLGRGDLHQIDAA